MPNFHNFLHDYWFLSSLAALKRIMNDGLIWNYLRKWVKPAYGPIWLYYALIFRPLAIPLELVIVL